MIPRSLLSLRLWSFVTSMLFAWACEKDPDVRIAQGELDNLFDKTVLLGRSDYPHTSTGRALRVEDLKTTYPALVGYVDDLEQVEQVRFRFSPKWNYLLVETTQSSVAKLIGLPDQGTEPSPRPRAWQELYRFAIDEHVDLDRARADDGTLTPFIKQTTAVNNDRSARRYITLNPKEPVFLDPQIAARFKAPSTATVASYADDLVEIDEFGQRRVIFEDIARIHALPKDLTLGQLLGQTLAPQPSRFLRKLSEQLKVKLGNTGSLQAKSAQLLRFQLNEDTLGIYVVDSANADLSSSELIATAPLRYLKIRHRIDAKGEKAPVLVGDSVSGRPEDFMQVIIRWNELKPAITRDNQDLQPSAFVGGQRLQYGEWLKRSFFTGNREFIYKAEVIGAASDASIAPGIMLQLDRRVRFVTEDNHLTVKQVDNRLNQDPVVQTTEMQFAAQYADVGPSLNAFGEATGPISLRKDRPKGARDYLKVHFGGNAISTFYNTLTYLTTEFSGTFSSKGGIVVERPRISEDGAFLTFVTEETLIPNIRSFSPPAGESAYEPQSIRIRHHFLVADDRSGYQPRPYSLAESNQFGFFVSTNRGFTQDGRATDSAVERLANLWHLKQGEPTIRYMLGPDTPEFMIEVINASIKAWNEALHKAFNHDMQDPSNQFDFITLSAYEPQAYLDPRTSRIVYHRGARLSAPFGYGPSLKDPKTGQILAAYTHIYEDAVQSVEFARRKVLEKSLNELNRTFRPVSFGAADPQDPATDPEPETEERGETRSSRSPSETVATAPQSDSRLLPEGHAAYLELERFLQANSSLTGKQADIRANFQAQLRSLRQPRFDRTAPGLDIQAWEALSTAVAAARQAGLQNPTLRLAESMLLKEQALSGQALGRELRLDSAWQGMARHLAARIHKQSHRHAPSFLDEANNTCFHPGAVHLPASFASHYVRGQGDKDLETLVEEALKNELIDTLTHEIGHNLGLRHNFRSSNDVRNYAPGFRTLYQDLQSASQSTPAERRQARERFETETFRYAATSVMEYTTAFDGFDVLIGSYDIAALKYAYAGKREVVLKDGRDAYGFVTATREIDISDFDGEATPQTDPTLLALEPGEELKPYDYCTDQLVDEDVLCNRFDAGYTAEQILDSLVGSYDMRYELYAKREGRRQFGDLPRLDMLIAARSFFEESTARRQEEGNPNGGFSRDGFEGAYSAEDFNNAKTAALDFLLDLIATPAPGTYWLDERASQSSQDLVFSSFRQTNSQGQQTLQIIIPEGFGKRLEAINTIDNVRVTTEQRGIEIDKFFAYEILTTSSPIGNRLARAGVAIDPFDDRDRGDQIFEAFSDIIYGESFNRTYTGVVEQRDDGQLVFRKLKEYQGLGRQIPEEAQTKVSLNADVGGFRPTVERILFANLSTTTNSRLYYYTDVRIKGLDDANLQGDDVKEYASVLTDNVYRAKQTPDSRNLAVKFIDRFEGFRTFYRDLKADYQTLSTDLNVFRPALAEFAAITELDLERSEFARLNEVAASQALYAEIAQWTNQTAIDASLAELELSAEQLQQIGTLSLYWQGVIGQLRQNLGCAAKALQANSDEDDNPSRLTCSKSARSPERLTTLRSWAQFYLPLIVGHLRASLDLTESQLLPDITIDGAYVAEAVKQLIDKPYSEPLPLPNGNSLPALPGLGDLGTTLLVDRQDMVLEVYAEALRLWLTATLPYLLDEPESLSTNFAIERFGDQVQIFEDFLQGAPGELAQPVEDLIAPMRAQRQLLELRRPELIARQRLSTFRMIALESLLSRPRALEVKTAVEQEDQLSLYENFLISQEAALIRMRRYNRAF